MSKCNAGSLTMGALRWSSTNGTSGRKTDGLGEKPPIRKREAMCRADGPGTISEPARYSSRFVLRLFNSAIVDLDDRPCQGLLNDSILEVSGRASHYLWLRVLWLALFAVTRGAVADGKLDPLTPAQRAWLETHPRIVIGGGDDWPPWLIRGKDGALSGFAVDHLALLNAKLGTAIQLEAGPWHEIVAEAEAGALDGLTLSAPLAERGAHFLFTQPFVTVPDFL